MLESRKNENETEERFPCKKPAKHPVVLPTQELASVEDNIYVSVQY
jgi:hypothetical protein